MSIVVSPEDVMTWLLSATILVGLPSVLYSQPAPLTILHRFQHSVTPAFPSRLTPLSDGGVLLTSGTGTGQSMISRVAADGTVTVLHVFTAASTVVSDTLVQGGDGYFYGATATTGTYPPTGTIFRLSAPGGAFETLYSFSGGVDGLFATRLRRAPDGTVLASVIETYPICCGSYHILTIEPGGRITPQAFTIPGPMFAVGTDGSVFGVAGGSSIFRRDPSGAISTLVTLPPGTYAAWGPLSDLIESSAGVLMGLAGRVVEPYGCDVIRVSSLGFEVTARTTEGCGVFGRSADEGAGKDVLGTLSQSVFRLSPTGTIAARYGQVEPVDVALRPDGTMVVATSHGGPLGGGQILAISPAGASSTVANLSAGNPDGWAPEGPVVQDPDGGLYGTTARGGSFDAGTIYRVSRAGEFRTIYSFTGRGDGGHPRGLVQLPNGGIFGSTRAGDTHTGTVFTVGRGGALTTIAVFRRGGDGLYPGPLVVGRDGQLYGRTAGGGRHGAGTMFRVTASGAVTVLHDFGPDDQLAAIPPGNGYSQCHDRLVARPDGTFLGATAVCSSYVPPSWSIFRATDRGDVRRLAGNTYQSPGHDLTIGPDGRVWGVLSGVPFSMSPDGAVAVMPHADGFSPRELSVVGLDGQLFGWGSDHSNSAPVLVRVTPAGVSARLDTVPPLHWAPSILVNGGDGFLYGGTEPGYPAAPDEVGVLFKVDLRNVPGVLRPPTNLRIVRP